MTDFEACPHGSHRPLCEICKEIKPLKAALAAARQDTYRRCAELCDAMFAHYRDHPELVDPTPSDEPQELDWIYGAETCAKAIRALAVKEK